MNEAIRTITLFQHAATLAGMAEEVVDTWFKFGLLA